MHSYRRRPQSNHYLWTIVWWHWCSRFVDKVTTSSFISRKCFNYQQHFCSPLAKNLFQGAILMSASTRIDYTLAQVGFMKKCSFHHNSSRIKAEVQNQVFLERTNCTDAVSAIECLYNMTSQQVTSRD